MDKDLKKKWCSALRSGEYKQGVGQLFDEVTNTHCCLGVLARVAGLEINEKGSQIIVGGQDCSYAPLKILIGDDTATNDLWHMNDDHKETFPQIAKWIEKHL